MGVHPELVVTSIIGQMGGNASGVFGRRLGGVLGVIRMPEWVPTRVGGLLFETQWLYWVIALAAAGVMVYLGRARADRRWVRIGVGIALATIVWMGLAFVVDTPRERLHRTHVEMAEAAKNGDVEKIVSFLEPDFEASALGIQQEAVAREEIASRLKAYGVKGSTITSYKSTISGKMGFTTLTLFTQTEIAGPVLTTWELSWDDVTGADWRLKNADLIKVGDEAMGPGAELPK